MFIQLLAIRDIVAHLALESVIGSPKSELTAIFAQVPHIDLASPEIGRLTAAGDLELEIDGGFLDIFGEPSDDANESPPGVRGRRQSFSAGFDTGDVGPGPKGPVIFTSGGRRHCFTLRGEGDVWSRPDAQEKLKTTWSRADEGADQASHHDRVGAPEADLRDKPAFEMMVARNGRAFAKANGRADYYIMVPAHDNAFVEADGVDRAFRYTAYNKLDPTLGRFDPTTTTPRRRFAFEWTNAHLSDANGRRFDAVAPESAFHHLFFLFDLVAALPVPAMAVRLEPNRWRHLDTRPEPGQAPPPKGSPYPTIANVHYRRRFWRKGAIETVRFDPNAAADERVVGRTYSYERVLSLGVGRLHPHDQADLRGRAEIGNLDYDLGEQDLEAAFEPADRRYILDKYGRGRLFWENFVRAFHGPIDDADGYNDGTVNYYKLVQFASDVELARRGDDLRNCFGVLNIDEQTAASGRWRLLHLEDYRNRRGLDADPDKGASSFTDSAANYLLSKLVWDERDVNAKRKRRRSFDFSARNYYCPFSDGRLDGSARMAVAQQLVAVSGRDDRFAEIHTINFSHSTMDRTWRRRSAKARFDMRGRQIAPMARELFAGEDAPDPATGDLPLSDASCAAAPSTIALRDDLTLIMRGQCRTRDGEVVAGRFHQPNKPASGRLPEPLDGGKEPSFEHEWQFTPEPIYWLFDRFPVFGALEPEDARFQAYAVHASSQTAETLERWVGREPGAQAAVSFAGAPPAITQHHVDIEKLKEWIRFAADRPEDANKAMQAIIGRAAKAEIDEFSDGLVDWIRRLLGMGDKPRPDQALSAEGLTGHMLLEIERQLVVEKRFAWPSRFNRDETSFKGRLMLRPPFGLMMAWEDHRDDELAALDRFEPIPGVSSRGFGTRIAAPLLTGEHAVWLGERVRPNPPRAQWVTVDSSQISSGQWRLRINMGLFRSSLPGSAPLQTGRPPADGAPIEGPAAWDLRERPPAYKQEAWRMKLGMFPDAPRWAEGRDVADMATGPAPEPTILFDVALEGRLQEHEGESTDDVFACFATVDVTPPAGLDTDIPPFSEAGRRRYGLSIWFENVLGRLGAPDRLMFR